MIRVAKGMDDVRNAMPDVEPLHQPSVDQYNMWRAWVRWREGCDVNGAFLGWCPMCWVEGGANNAPGWYNFSRGTFECSEACCHEGKRGLTLVTLTVELAKRALNG